MNKVPAPVGPYSPIVRGGDNRFVSGQIGVVEGELVDGIDAQSRAAITNLKVVLESVIAPQVATVPDAEGLLDADDEADPEPGTDADE